MNLGDIKRNDVKAAVEYMRAQGGKLSPEAGQFLYMLQDDPTELMKAIEREPTPPKPAALR